MSTIIDTLERIMFGATAQERVDQINALIAQKVDQRLNRIVEGLKSDSMPCERCGQTTLDRDLEILSVDGVDLLACPSCIAAYESSESKASAR